MLPSLMFETSPPLLSPLSPPNSPSLPSHRSSLRQETARHLIGATSSRSSPGPPFLPPSAYSSPPSTAFSLPRSMTSSQKVTARKGFEQEDPETDEEVNQERGQKELGSGEYGRLYVGILPFSMTSTQLAEVFQEAGRVVNAEVLYDRVTDRSRGFAFVTMGSIGEANEAIRMFDGSSLRDAFAEQPGLLSAKIIYDRSSGRSRGFGFVSFESAEAVESALNAMNRVVLEGRSLRLNLAAERALSPPTVEANAGNSPESSELASSIPT